MSRGGSPSQQRKGRPPQTVYRITQAELVNRKKIKAGTVKSSDGNRDVHDLWWDTKLNGLQHFDEKGNTFYPASSVMSTRYDIDDEVVQ